MRIFLTIIILLLLLLPQKLWAQEKQKYEKKESDPKQESLQKSSASGKVKANMLFLEFENRRNANLSPNSKKIPQSEQRVLDSLVTEMQRQIPGTYEYHYAAYLNSNRSAEQFHHLEKAHKLEPAKTELYSDFIAHYEITNQPNKKKEFIEKWHKAGGVSRAIYDYNYNVLQSVEANSILFTNGTMDTHPLWILQEMESVQPGVLVLNFDLLQDEKYRKQILLQLNLQPKGEGTGAFLAQLLGNDSLRPVYFGLTVPPVLLDSLKKNLYVTGLTFRYSKQSFNNLEVLKDNWENKFRGLDNLNSFSGKKYRAAELEISNSAFTRNYDDHRKRDLNTNYLVPALLLYKYYEQINEPKKAKNFEELALNLATTDAERKKINSFTGKVKGK